MDTPISITGAPSPLEEARLLEPALKRALYEGTERVRGPKAPLYLGASHSANNAFELVTSYGWNAPPARLDAKSPIVSRLASTQMPLMVNSVAADRVVAEALFEQGCERVLALPIFGRARHLAGILDLRDKAGRKSFEAADVAAADTIREAIEKVLATKQLYGIRGSVVEAPKPRPAATASPGALDVIRAARDRMARRIQERDAARRVLSREELETLRVVLPAVL